MEKILTSENRQEQQFYKPTKGAWSLKFLIPTPLLLNTL